MKRINTLPCVIMRGGTSKGIFINSVDMPPLREEWEQVICSLFGSPDPRQIDGLGGADPLTSKVAIIGPSSVAGADVDYTFGQVSINELNVDFKGNCGNLTSAVGPFSIDQGYLKPAEPVTEVKIYNTNTAKILKAYVPVENGRVKYCGDYSIAGVPGSASLIELDFAATKGSSTGKLIPTGNCIDILDIAGIGKVECSIIDIANPVVFLRAADMGLRGLETASEIDADKELLQKLELIRATAAARIGMCASVQTAIKECPSVPLLAMVSKPEEEGITIISRLIFMQVTHKTYSGTATVCTGAAVKLPGTIPYELASWEKQDDRVVIGHPAGCIDVKISMEPKDGDWEVRRALIGRTARKIMEGTAFYTL